MILCNVLLTLSQGTLQSILSYLDSEYISHKSDLGSVRYVSRLIVDMRISKAIRRTLAYELFANRIFDEPQILQKIQDGIREWIDWERKNEAEHTSRGIIGRLINRLVHHGRYQTIFEEFYVKNTLEFYKAESKHLRDTASAAQFMQRCEGRDIQEQTRSAAILPSVSWDKVEDTTRCALLGDRLEWIAKEGSSLTRSYTMCGV